MRSSFRKLIGTALIVALVIVYSLVATAVATAFLAESHWFIQMIYFLFTGVLWIVPAMAIIKWMMKPDQASTHHT